ncbi:MAG: hypothetical protein KDD73_01555 [Anaerolineales bacterium]|nr:hypothetical protein [Anaerolineales bacterium]MCB9127414.1 hypothetical protein [Ardenticatenales bacterium]
MKRIVLLAAFAFLVLAALSTSASAQGLSYTVGIQIKNLDSVAAENAQIVYYNMDGSVAGTLDLPTIPANGSVTYAQVEGVGDGFSGSAVINSANQLAAIVNVCANGICGMGASYTAFDSGDTTAGLPLIMRNNSGYSTLFNVQNVGSGAANVTVTYSNGTTETAVIQPNAAHRFDQATNTNLGNVFVGSATVTSDVPVVATVLEQGATTLFGYDGFRSGDASTNPVMPLVNANNSGYITGIQIQNRGTASTTVTVNYTPSSAGTACQETQTIAGNGASATFALNAFSGTYSGENCANGAAFVGSATVTANSSGQPLVAIVNQLNIAANKGAAYGGFNPANGSSIVELPLIMDRNSGFWTGFAITNVGTQNTNITCTYVGSAHVDSQNNVQPGGSFTVINLNVLGAGYVGAATCTASGGDAKIVGIVNELKTDATGDTFLVYEGTNR